MSAEHEFPNTRWSIILEARDDDSALRHRALEQICRTYWLPIYGFARGQGLSPSDAEDLTQNVLSRLLDKQAFEKVAAEKGKLRSFLRAATKNYLRNEWDKAKAQKRGGCATVLSLDYEDAERRISQQVSDEDSPDRLFDRQWGLNLLGRTMDGLEGVYVSEGKGAVFAVLKDVIGLKRGGPRHKDLASELGMSESAVGVAIHRLRKRYRRILKEQIALTLDDESEEAVKFNRWEPDSSGKFSFLGFGVAQPPQSTPVHELGMLHSALAAVETPRATGNRTPSNESVALKVETCIINNK